MKKEQLEKISKNIIDYKNPVKGNKDHAKQGKWHYQDIRSALKSAGYSVQGRA